jgi:hypothetical protein
MIHFELTDFDQAPEWGVIKHRNMAIERVAGTQCNVWGNLLVFKTRGDDDRVLDIEPHEISLIERIVVSEVVDYPLDQD